jgi:hypothetical protein
MKKLLFVVVATTFSATMFAQGTAHTIRLKALPVVRDISQNDRQKANGHAEENMDVTMPITTGIKYYAKEEVIKHKKYPRILSPSIYRGAFFLNSVQAALRVLWLNIQGFGRDSPWKKIPHVKAIETLKRMKTKKERGHTKKERLATKKERRPTKKEREASGKGFFCT